MADSLLNSSISAVRTKIINDIATASVKDLVSLARAAKALGLGDDADVENAINTRVNSFASSASVSEIKDLSQAIKQVKNEYAATINNADDIIDGSTNKFLSTSNLNTELGSLSTNIVPDNDVTRNLGSAGNKFNTIYGAKVTGLLSPIDSGDAATKAYVDSNASSIQWTRFYFDRGGVTPSTVSNSENVGKNFGSWTETTSANTGSTFVTPTSSTYDPTLTGITVNSNGEFQFPAGVYEVNASIQFKIYNTSSNLQKYDFYLYGESGSNWAGSYDEQLLVPPTSLLVNNDMMIKMNGLYVFENATQANNILYLQMGTSSQPVNANMFPDFGFLDIKKIG